MTLLSTAALSLLLLLLSCFTLGTPLTPEEVHNWRQPSGTLLLFVGWALSSLAWGELLRRKLRLAPTFLERLALGSLFYAAIAAALLILPLPNSGLHWIFFAVAALGPLGLIALEGPHNKWRFWITRNTKIPVALFPICFFFLVTFLRGAFPSEDIMPLWRTLPDTRRWFDSGTAGFSGAWDYLYVWSHALLGGDGSRGLITAQIFSQWIHTAIAGGIVALSLYRIFRTLSDGNEYVTWTAVLAGLIAPALTQDLALAASTWGAMAWVLFGFSLAHQEKRYLSGSTVLGLGVATSMNNIFFALPLVLMLSVSHWQEKNLRLLLKTCGGFLLGIAPLLLAHLLLPQFSLLSSWRTMLHSQETKNAFLFAGQSIFIPLALVAPIINWYFRREWSRSGYFILALWFGLLWFLLVAGTKANPQLLGVGIPLLAGLGVVSVARLGKLFRPALLQNQFGFLGLITLLFFIAHLPLLKLSSLIQLRNLTPIIYAHPSGRVEAWIRNNVEPTALIASMAEARLYYLQGMNVLRVWDIPELNEKLRTSKTLLEALQFLESQGVRYLLDTSDLAGLQDVHRPFLEQFWEAVNKQRVVILFQTQEARVIDLARLIKRLPH